MKQHHRRAWLGVTIALGLALHVSAQTNATIVLRSGERRPAQNIGFFDGRQLVVRTSFQEEPRFPIEEVAYIDFGGTSDRQIDASGGEAVMLRNGRILRGQVTRIAHTDQNDQTSPYVVTFRAVNGGEQQLTGNDIGRIYFNAPSGAAAEPAGTSGFGRRRGPGETSVGGNTRTITVPARQRWTPTGITVNAGEVLQLRTSGQIRLNAEGTMVASPDGAQDGHYDPQSPMPQTLAGALIARIGNGAPFGIGTMSQVQMPGSGLLFLGVNDSNLNDNDGAFTVEIGMPYRQ